MPRSYLDVLLNFTYEEAYDGYMEWLENVTSTTPYMVAVSNGVRVGRGWGVGRNAHVPLHCGTRCTLFLVLPTKLQVGNHESECHSPACILDAPALGEKLNNFTAYNVSPSLRIAPPRQ